MNSRLLLTDISNALAADRGVSKRKAEMVARAMFDVIEEGLLRDQVVKVKGLGTFKLIVVSARESVSVNTGKRIQIESYTKVTFTPEKQIAELVNRPFRDFETVQLHAGTPLAELEAVDKEQVAAAKPAPVVAEEVPAPPVVETPAATEEVPAPPAPPVVETPVVTEEVPAPLAPPVVETPAATEEVPAPPAPPVVETPVVTEEVPAPPAVPAAPKPAPIADASASPAPPAAPKPAPVADASAPSAPKNMQATNDVAEEPAKSKGWGKKAMLAVVCAAAIVLLALIYYIPSQKSATEGQQQTATAQQTQPKQEQQIEAETPAASPAVETGATPAATPAGHFYINLATGVTQELGENFIKQLQEKGFPDARLQEDTYLRVVYGDFPDKASADAMLARLKGEAGIKDAWVEEAK
ncbi:MAG: HU family DNA-binding protein [Alloprevotella sp.]|nr:HU family DNA-binding protein [Alloprevotella sp.]